MLCIVMCLVQVHAQGAGVHHTALKVLWSHNNLQCSFSEQDQQETFCINFTQCSDSLCISLAEQLAPSSPVCAHLHPQPTSDWPSAVPTQEPAHGNKTGNDTVARTHIHTTALHKNTYTFPCHWVYYRPPIP